MQIIIQHIPYSSSEFEYNTSSSGNSIVYSLIQHLSEIFGNIASINNSNSLLSSSLQTPATTMPPAHLYDTSRKQWISDKILDWLLRNYSPNSNTKVLAICNFDAYSDNLNFVLGEAHLGGRVAAIYIPRLRQDFYVKKSDTNKLFEQRVIKEAVHELGHAFGLTHCEESRCVMHFSNSLQDTDFKHYIFCERCNKVLKEQTTDK
ncbi:MAG: archaemetzincin family Zn-dependent metalloprotease [Thermoproteota archaeon]|nr:archaemetzincin family Zn-dependent metalloprotease [Thermoproteota archaeon]